MRSFLAWEYNVSHHLGGGQDFPGRHVGTLIRRNADEAGQELSKVFNPSRGMWGQSHMDFGYFRIPILYNNMHNAAVEVDFGIWCNPIILPC